MKFVMEYREFAEEYRKLADELASPKDKDALKLLARVWDRVAAEREHRLNNQAVGERLDHARLNEADGQRRHYHGSGCNLFHLGSVMDQRIFVTQLNIEHYRRKLLTEQNEAARERIAQLLAEEEAKLAAQDGRTERKGCST